MNAVKLLQKYKINVTDLRLLIIDELIKSKDALCYDDFASKMNKTTFYRNIELFESNNLLLKIEINGKGYYKLNTGSNALFVCDICHHTKGIDLPKIDNLHINSVLIKGVCDECEEEE